MNKNVINYYKETQEDYSLSAIFTLDELEKAYAECSDLSDGYVFCYSKSTVTDKGRFHGVACWKKMDDNRYKLICRSKNELNVTDLLEQRSWMKDVAKRHVAKA